MKLNWRTKLMGLFVIVLGVSLLFQVFYVIPFIQDREVKMTEIHQEEITGNIAREADNNLKRFRNRLTKIAELPAFHEMDIADQHQVISENVEVTPLIFSIFVLDDEGRIVSGSVDDLSSYTARNYAEEPFFSSAFDQGKAYFGDPQFYETEGIVAVPVSVPINSPTEERVGVLRGSIKLRGVIEIADHPLSKGQIAYVVDREGTVIVHSEIDLSALEGGPPPLNYSNNPQVQAFIERGMGGSQKYDHDGTPYFGTYTTMETNGWRVVVERPMSAILAETETLARRLLTINAGLFIITLLVTLVFTGQITGERKQAEEEVKKEKEKAEKYLGIAEVMLATIDADENTTLMNKKGCEILGYNEGELIGKNWFDLLVPQEIREEVRGVFGKLMTGNIGPVKYYENPLLTKNGEQRMIAFHNTVIRDSIGQISGALLSGQDITERKKAEEKLKNQKEELSAFGHTVSHDLKNYIGTIRNRAQLTLMKKETAEKNAQKTIDITKKMETFVNRQL
ncbi:MAG: cache domain-containing protein, partial [Euryarchaeota archaeon]|nr:cache domain-containing protein [Euryarchaeota archaeon]